MISKEEIEKYSEENTEDKIIAGFDHYQRIYKHAREIIEGEYDDDVLHAAAFLHDLVIDDPHEQKSVEKAINFLKESGWSQEKLDAVKHCILEHVPNGKPETKEAIAIHDSDMLDFLGATGITRLSIWAREWNEATTIKEVLELIKKFRELAINNLVSEKAKELAKDKIKIMDKAIKELEKEV